MDKVIDEKVRQELVLLVANMLLLELTAEARNSGRITTSQFACIAEAMSIMLAAYEVAHLVKTATTIPGGNGTVN